MNRILYADDCLNVLNDPTVLPDESVDLIYLDPPFNSNSIYNLPFKDKDKSRKPVAAFMDAWGWEPQDDMRLAELERNPNTGPLATIVQFALGVEQVSGGIARSKASLASYLLNMAQRLRAMRRALKPTGSIYLHCDPTASHYLKLVMDAIFGRKNFKNEVVWGYRTGGVSKKMWPRKHDIILCYGKTNQTKHIPQTERIYYEKPFFTTKIDEKGSHYADIRDVWDDIKAVINVSKERLGYPTQKPLALLERIIKASSDEGDLVLDPFCGCGTTVHAAESLGRRWVGIDIAPFSTELIRERIVGNFRHLNKDDVRIIGIPETIDAAQELAARDKFEFEKWVCGAIGAHGLYQNKAPGDRGADGGVDGVMEIDVVRNGKVQREYAIVQVKGGKVTADSVKALSETVRRAGAIAGILVCFENQMRTVNNQRSHETWSDDYEAYPVIQGYSVEALLDDRPLRLPRRYGNRRGGRISGAPLWG